MDIAELEPRADEAVELLSAMANTKRLLILCQLLDNELSVGELSERIDLAQSPLSQHLARLRAMKLVAARRDGQSIRYRLASEEVAKELGLPIKMRLVSYAFAGVAPEVMAVGPIPSTEKALAKAGLTIDDIEAFEINEAFAIQVLAFLDHFGIAEDDSRVNPYGGAIAFGHPLASSGVRLMIQLARQFEERPEVRYGLTTMCIGLGMGGTVIWENPNWNGKEA